jgi:acyl-CoA reductase-like NAD-dependent aldehyde dehydrogenase
MIERGFYSVLPIQSRTVAALAFHALLDNRQEELARASADTTKTPIKHHLEDVLHARVALEALLEPLSPEPGCLWRSKGIVVLGLSANEPLIVGIVPVFASYLAGNTTLVRPASKNRKFMTLLLELMYESGVEPTMIRLIPQDLAELDAAITAADHVVWFGSSDTCVAVGKKALDAHVTFIGEAEGYDIAIFDETVSESSLPCFTDWVIRSIARHDGQTCQAIRAILVHEDVFSAVDMHLRHAIERLVIGEYNDPKSDCTARPVLEYGPIDPYPEQSPFCATARVAIYTNEYALSNLLTRNPFALSVAYFSSRAFAELQSGPLSFCRVGRIVFNADPYHVDPRRPWGGYRRSGTSGPTRWLSKFADLTVIADGEQ